MNVVLRAEQEKDFNQISELHISNFHHDLEANLIFKLRDEDGYKSWLSQVLVLGEEVVGHVMLTPVKIQNCDEAFNALVIGPVSIKKEYQGKGYGTKMISDVLKLINESEYKIALVYGGDYYKRFGFEKAEYVFRPNPVIGHGILIKTFGEIANASIRGVIHYPHAFDLLINEWNR